MNLAVSPSVQRAAALAILAALVLAVVTGVVEPLVSAYLDAARSVAQERAVIARAQASGLDPAALQAELTRLRADRGPIPGALHGANESLAAAELQNRLKAAIDAAHGELRSVQALPSHVDGSFRRITIRGRARLKIAGLRDAVYALEAAPPYLFLDDVAVDAHPDQSGRPGAGEDPDLDVRLDVSAYMGARS
jgi:hypothetical protein